MKCMAEDKLSPAFYKLKGEETESGYVITQHDLPNGHDIIASGPLVRKKGIGPVRIVLRYTPGKAQPYYTHRQCIPDGLGPEYCPSFEAGVYFSDKAKAIKNFCHRVLTLSDID